MSLILEALKKLERERETTGRGFLVVAHTPWRERRGQLARLALLSIAAGALAGGTAWMVWALLNGRPRAAAVPPRPAATVAPAAADGATLPPPIWESRPAPRPAAAPAAGVAAPAAAPPRPAASAQPAAAPEDPPLLVIAPAATVALRLEAISAQDGEPVAVINGQVVRKGDTIEGALVLWIGADAVEVEAGGRRRVLGF